MVLTSFTADNVMLKDVPATSSAAVPEFPLPLTKVSPGSVAFSSTAWTAIDGLVFELLVPSEESAAVIVWEPVVPKVELIMADPLARVPPGEVNVPSVELSAITSVEVTLFQFASTALTVTLKGPRIF